MTPQQLLTLVQAGGSIIVNAGAFTPTQLLSLVQGAKGAQATVTIRNALALTPQSALALAQAGRGGTVVLDYA